MPSGSLHFNRREQENKDLNYIAYQIVTGAMEKTKAGKEGWESLGWGAL